MKRIFLHPAILLLLGLGLSLAPAQTNVAPTVVIVHAGMRPGTTLMDTTFRVDDPDDATVKVRALAFKDGVRSFANAIRPVTFVEGTGDKIGDAIPANATHALVWDVGADWNIDLGQAKFEILAMDGRGLLSFDWITIPAAGGYPQTTVSTNSPTSTEVMNALYWLYASGDTGLSLTNGVLSGTSQSGVFQGFGLATNASTANYATPFVFKRMNVDVATREDFTQAKAARVAVTSNWLAVNRPYASFNVISAWGRTYVWTSLPTPTANVTAIAIGDGHGMALKAEGNVVGWGRNDFGQATPPSGLTGVTAIAAGYCYSLALNGSGSVVGWGQTDYGQTWPPTGLTGVTAIAAGDYHGLALKSDGNVVGWGRNNFGQATVPAGLTGVTAIATGSYHSLVLKSDGTVVAWGMNDYGQTNTPAGLTGVTAIDAGYGHSLALKSDGTVVGWGLNGDGQATPPTGLTEVTAIAAGRYHNLALKSDGTVVSWGRNNDQQTDTPAGLTGVITIAAGGEFSVVLKRDAPAP